MLNQSVEGEIKRKEGMGVSKKTYFKQWRDEYHSYIIEYMQK